MVLNVNLLCNKGGLDTAEQTEGEKFGDIGTRIRKLKEKTMNLKSKKKTPKTNIAKCNRKQVYNQQRWLFFIKIQKDD